MGSFELQRYYIFLLFKVFTLRNHANNRNIVPLTLIKKSGSALSDEEKKNKERP